jgi:hypothetical protein
LNSFARSRGPIAGVRNKLFTLASGGELADAKIRNQLSNLEEALQRT